MINRRRTDSAMQKYSPTFVTLATVGTAPGTGNGTFKIVVPDNRLRTKISLVFVGPAGSNYNTGLATTGSIWLAGTDNDQGGTSGRTIPVTNLEGTRAAPTAFPSADGLMGYSREFNILTDNVEGVWTLLNPPQGTLQLQVTYAPDAVRFTPDEWNAITQACAMTSTSGATVHFGG